MIDIKIKPDFSAFKQLFLFGILVTFLEGLNLAPRFPQNGDAMTYITWLIMFIVLSAVYGLIVIALLLGSGAVIKKLR